MDLQLIRKEMEKKDGKRIFLFYGKESFIYQEMILTARLSLLSKELVDFNETRLDGRQHSMETVLNTARTPPVLDPYRLTLVHDAPYFKAEKKESSPEGRRKDPDAALLEEFIRERIPFSCLIFTCDDVDLRRSINRLIAQHGLVLECKPLQGRELTSWIEQRIRRLGKTMTRDAVQVLVDTVGDDLRLLRQELMKIAAYAGEKPTIDREDVLAVASRTVENNIFSLIDQLGRKNRQQALRTLGDMLMMNEPPVRILFMIIQQMRLLLDCRQLLAEGIGRGELAGLLNMNPYRVQKALDHLPTFSEEDLERILTVLLQADEDMKSGQGSPRLILETVLIRMSA